MRAVIAFLTALLAVDLETVPLLGADCTFLVVEDLLAGDFLLVAMGISDIDKERNVIEYD